jgi:hypothetical protein
MPCVKALARYGAAGSARPVRGARRGADEGAPAGLIAARSGDRARSQGIEIKDRCWVPTDLIPVDGASARNYLRVDLADLTRGVDAQMIRSTGSWRARARLCQQLINVRRSMQFASRQSVEQGDDNLQAFLWRLRGHRDSE